MSCNKCSSIKMRKRFSDGQYICLDCFNIQSKKGTSSKAIE